MRVSRRQQDEAQALVQIVALLTIEQAPLEEIRLCV
jgi:hypothetical protein